MMERSKIYSIAGFQCSNCGMVSFPRHTRCRSCRGTEFKEVPLTKGRVITSTRITATRPGFEKELFLAVAEFEGGVRILAQVQGTAPPPTGATVEMGEGVLSKTKDGGDRRGFKFVYQSAN